MLTLWILEIPSAPQKSAASHHLKKKYLENIFGGYERPKALWGRDFTVPYPPRRRRRLAVPLRKGAAEGTHIRPSQECARVCACTGHFLVSLEEGMRPHLHMGRGETRFGWTRGRIPFSCVELREGSSIPTNYPTILNLSRLIALKTPFSLSVCWAHEMAQ